jgi:hypothetical protein
MSKHTHKAIEATIRHFETAANHGGDAAHAINVTATGLVCLTGVIADLFEKVEALRAEVKALREAD